ncbi:hypothetical protein GC173_11130 [bacterium]|nr:hypothetical protein [bacterium]
MLRYFSSGFAVAAALLLSHNTASAQFNLKSWENFESGIPAGSIMLHNSNATNTRVVSYASLGDPNLTTPEVQRECGAMGLQLQTNATQRFLCITVPVVLERARLGTTGRALFQADVYLPGKADIGHSAAVLAVGTDGRTQLKPNQSFWNLYRFGCIGGERAFFSYTNGSAAPKIYLHDKLSSLGPERSGWHRFQFIVEGQTGISCYVDGVLTSFSPIQENTLAFIQPGIMVTAPVDKPYSVLLDNLSIQWTMDPATPVPQSPWVTAEEIAGSVDRVQWRADIPEALAEGRQTGKPTLALFYMPGNVTSQDLFNNVFQNSDEARQYLNSAVLTRVDVNQLRGSAVARQYSVARVPSLLVLGPDGKELGRVDIAQGERWKQIQPRLKAIMESGAAQ